MLNFVIRGMVQGKDIFPDVDGHMVDLIDQHCGLVPDVFEIGETQRGLDYHTIRRGFYRLTRKGFTEKRQRDRWPEVLTTLGRARLCKFRNHQRFRCQMI